MHVSVAKFPLLLNDPGITEIYKVFFFFFFNFSLDEKMWEFALITVTKQYKISNFGNFHL